MRRLTLGMNPLLIGLTTISMAVVLTTLVVHRALRWNPLAVPEPAAVAVSAFRLRTDEYFEVRARIRGLAMFGAYLPRRARLGGQGWSEQGHALLVTPECLEILGVRAIGGRLLLPRDAQEAARVALVRESLWRRHFGPVREPQAEELEIQDETFEIVGILPDTFRGLSLESTPDVLVPFWTAGHSGTFLQGPLLRSIPAGSWLLGLGRLTTGGDLERVNAESFDILASMTDGRFRPNGGPPAVFEGITEAAIPDDARAAIRSTLDTLGVLAILTVVVATANTVNLLGLQLLRRRQEMALRQLLGGTRSRILWEGTLTSGRLGLIGGGAGTLVAFVLLSGLDHVRLGGFMTLTPDLGIRPSEAVPVKVGPLREQLHAVGLDATPQPGPWTPPHLHARGPAPFRRRRPDDRPLRPAPDHGLSRLRRLDGGAPTGS